MEADGTKGFLVLVLAEGEDPLLNAIRRGGGYCYC